MELFPKSAKDIFRRRGIETGSDSDFINTPDTKQRLQHWENASLHKTVHNETALESEMQQTLEEVKDYLHRLDVISLVHSKKTTGVMRDWARQQLLDRQLKDQIVLGHTLLDKVKELQDLEDTGVRMRMSRTSRGSLSNQTSATGLSNLIEQSESEIRHSSSRYSSEIKDVIRKFHRVLNNKDRTLPLSIYELDLEDDSKDGTRKKKVRNSLQFLVERLASDNIQPIFISLPLKPSESLHTVSCKVFNITEEGKAPEKTAAKMAAAVKMLEHIVEDSLHKRLPPQITPFTELELEEAVEVLCTTERYDVALAQLCAERRKLAPRYETDITSGKQWTRIYCSGLGLQGGGTHQNPTIAKRAAAREVLQQFKQKPKY